MFPKSIGGWTVKKVNAGSARKQVVISLVSVALGLLFCGVLLALTGNNPIALYGQIVSAAFGSAYGLSETVVYSVPLILCSLGVMVAFRMKLWNIGAEGQLYMGAFGATFFALTFPNLPGFLLLPLMALAGVVCGGLWALIPAVPKALWNVNETISTLLLNYIAMLWVTYLVYGPWRDPHGKNFPLTAQFSAGATLPVLVPGTRITVAVLFAVLLAVVFYFLMKYSKWGYEIRVSGGSRLAADYAGISYVKNVLLVLFVSGALSGFAGMAEVSGLIHRLQQSVSPGYGNTAIIIALIAKLNPLSILLVSFLMGALLVGGYSLQTAGFPSSIVSMFQGAILFFVLAGELLNNYRLVRVEKEARA